MKKLFVLAVLLFGIAGQASAAKYVVRDLGVLPGTVSSEAKGVNDSGEVVGVCTDAQGNSHGFYWSAAKGMVELKPLAGDKHCIAYAINNKGLIAGGSGMGGQNYRLFLRKMTEVRVTTGPRGTDARAINELGQAAGRSKYNTAGIRNTNGRTAHLGGGVAFGINNLGQAVGERYDSVGKAHIAIYWAGVGSSFDLGKGVASDINDNGQIVGANKSAVVWDREGNVKTLPTLSRNAGGTAQSINNAGQIVGTLGGAAVLWNPDNTVTTLSGLPGGSQTNANCISESGLIVGQGKDASGALRAVLWEAGP